MPKQQAESYYTYLGRIANGLCPFCEMPLPPPAAAVPGALITCAACGGAWRVQPTQRVSLPVQPPVPPNPRFKDEE